MESCELIPPSDDEIRNAQKRLGFSFSSDYIAFIKSGYDLADAPLDALEIVKPPRYLDIYRMLADAREHYDLPKTLLPICEDNSDLYCLSENGEVVFWSHNGITDERWSSVSEWCNQMIVESRNDR